ncbi:t-snare domain-containing protein [Anaeramoeba flamelloides]|uniref:T-snare domain-containing protein n=1 Tax=Anaeramoeba flamelloides TaxID=1746091 RepID=A0ABQ8YKX2_9EUKA|nr:t-snare domain-containing protein [Anaeramoeba flamelloides]
MSFEDQMTGGGENYQSSRKQETKSISKFDKMYQKVVQNTHSIAQSINRLKTMGNNIGRNQDTENFRQRIQQLISNIESLIENTNSSWKTMKREMKNSDKHKVDKLENFWNEIQTNFKKLRKDVDKKLREYLPKQEVVEDEKDDLKKSLLEQDQREMIQLENQIDFQNDIINEREEGILEIEAAVTDVNEMMRDIASMVHEQGKGIELIADNVETAKHRVEDGVDNLRTANKYQKKSRKKSCWLLLIIACVILIVVVVVILGVKL